MGQSRQRRREGSVFVQLRWKSSWLDPALDYIEGVVLSKQHLLATLLSAAPSAGSKPKTDSHLNEAGAHSQVTAIHVPRFQRKASNEYFEEEIKAQLMHPTALSAAVCAAGLNEKL